MNEKIVGFIDSRYTCIYVNFVLLLLIYFCQKHGRGFLLSKIKHCSLLKI
jgi:hypothetical protein